MSAKLFIYYSLIFLYSFTTTVFSQIIPLDPPLYLEQTGVKVTDNIIEAKIFPEYDVTLVQIHNFRNIGDSSELRFEDLNLQVIDDALYFPETLISNNLFIFDYDNDGFDELLISLVAKHEISFLLYDAGEEPKSKKLSLTIPTAKKYCVSSINFAPVNADEDIYSEVVISFYNILPVKKSERGIYLFDINSDSLRWHYPTAEYAEKILVSNSDAEPIILFAGSGVDNRLAFSESTYFWRDEQTDQYIPVTYLSEKRPSKLNPNASDYSIDTCSAITALDKNGKLLWKKELGGDKTWVSFHKAVANQSVEYYYHLWRRKASDRKPNYICKFAPKTGVILAKKEFRRYFSVHEQISGDSLIITHSDSIYFINKNLTVLFSKYIGRLGNFSARVPYKNNVYYLFNTPSNATLLNENFEKVMAINSPAQYFPLSNKIIRTKTSEEGLTIYSFNKINEKNLLSRINKNTYFIGIIALAILIIIIILLWAVTMVASLRKIRKKEKDLEETTAKLIMTEKLAVLGTISSGIAHELNSPLGAIINSIERLTEADSHLLQDPNISLISRAAKRCKTIAEKFLVTARFEKNEEQTCNLVDVLSDWRELFEGSLIKVGIELKTIIKETRLVKIKYSELHQILTNIIFNARDSVLELGGKLQIIIISEPVGERCRLTITDTGNGFPEAALKNAFTAFFTTKERGKGTGLGLWIVKKILDENNGDITINNTINGAEVIIYLNAIT